MNFKKVFLDGIMYFIPKGTTISVSDSLQVSLKTIQG